MNRSGLHSHLVRIVAAGITTGIGFGQAAMFSSADVSVAFAHASLLSPVLRTIPMYGAQAEATDERSGRVFVAGNGVLTLLNARSGQPLNTTPIGAGPYALAVDDQSNRVVVVSNVDSQGLASNQGTRASVTVLDATSGGPLVKVPLTQTTGIRSSVNVALDMRTGRAFITLRATNGFAQPSTLVIDIRTGLVVRRLLKVGGFGVATDARTGGIFAYGDPGTIMLDPTTGAIRKYLPFVTFAMAIDSSRGLGFAVGRVASTTSLAVIVFHTFDGSIVNTAPLGESEDSEITVKLNPSTHRAFVLAYPSDAQKPENVTVFDSLTAAHVNAVTVPGNIAPGGTAPEAFAFAPRLRRAYLVTVLPDSSQQITTLDARTGAILAGAVMGKWGEGASGGDVVTVDDVTGLAFVANSADSSVSILPAAFGLPAPILTTRLPMHPDAVAVDNGDHHAVVVSSADDRASVVDMRTGALLHTVHTGGHPVAVAVDSATHHAFVANYRSRSVTVIDAGTGAVLHSVNVGKNPNDIGIDTITDRAFVTNPNSDSVSVLDTRRGTLVRTVTVGAVPIAVAVDERRHRVLVANRDGNSVSVLDARSGRVLHTVTVSTSPDGIAADVLSGHTFVDSTVARSVTSLDTMTGKVLTSTPTVTGALGVSPATGRVFVASQSIASVSALASGSGAVVLQGPTETQGTAATVAIAPGSVGRGPHAITINSHVGHVLVANAPDDTITVLDAIGGTVLGTVAVGDTPTAPAVDTVNGRSIVADTTSREVSILSV